MRQQKPAPRGAGFCLTVKFYFVLFLYVQNPRLLFYINPFSKGSIFGPKEIDNFLKQLKLKPEKSFYEPCGNAEILQRMIRNLIFSFTKLGHDDKVEELENLLKALGD